MEQEKSKSHITTKPAAQSGTGGKSETVEDDKAALVKGSRLPAYLQRAGSTAEEEKEKMILKQKAIQLQKLSSALFSESEKKK